MSTPVPTPERDRQPLPAARPGAESPSVRSLPLSQRFARLLPFLPGLVPVAILAGIVIALLHASGLRSFGWAFFGLTWNPPRDQWGIGVFAIGSLISAVPALFFSMAIGIGLAVASTTYLPKFVTQWLDPFVDLLAGIPSVVYGIWAFIIVAPYFGAFVEPPLHAYLGFVPGLGPPIRPDGLGLLISIFILTLMALPITTLLIRDALRSVPHDLWESGLALGATRWEVVRRVALPYARRGIWSAAFLGFGRAFGETVAVAMIIGSATVLPHSFYDIANTMAAEMFETLDSAFGGTGAANFLSALSEMALVLLIISLVVNLLGRRLIVTLYAEPVAGL